MADKKERSVFIDYLAFSSPLSAMKDVDSFPEKGFEWRKFQYLPSYKHYQNSAAYICADSYQDIPEYTSSGLTEEQQSRYLEDLCACYFSRLRTWISSVFGLVVGVPRGTGGFAYHDSAVLYSDEGGSDHMGMVYWGGNKDTFYVQISGSGCTHVFSGTTPQKIHKWFKYLDITRLKRLDLATDDYEGVFSVSAAKLAHKDDAFYGGMGKRPKIGIKFEMDGDGCITHDEFNVGSRQSRVYWRIYNKAVEQRVSGTWNRSEVELKEISVDALLDIAGIYTGLCAYAAQIDPAPPVFLPRLLGRKAVDSIEAKVKWLRNQASASIAKVFHFFNGDIETVLSMIVREDHI
ncbi:replication initiation factor domain-containing protein, partial [Photorhabdus temperata]|uniref:replication initiation factor domain-containing protein n=1 Tax=Photorhabdus temperata TaxID=574560 RepID=UPI0021D4F004